MVSFPPCKINLGLHILARRDDGYHDIETCFYPIPWTDVLEIIPAREFSFTSTGLKIEGDLSSNLCVKAYGFMKQHFDLPPVSIHLHKILPMGAGIGGGSSDAAHTLMLLDKIFQLNAGELLYRFASSLGSDCSFFLQQHPMIGKGRGNEMTSIDLKLLSGMFIVLVKPEVHVSTAEAYARVRPKQPERPLDQSLVSPVSSWPKLIANDFEESVFGIHPIIARIKEELYAEGAVYASMSGSGSCVYGIFEKRVELQPSFASHTYWSGVLP